MEEREDDETTSTSSNQNSSACRQKDCSPSSFTKNCRMTNWNTRAFRAWQSGFHGQGGEIDEAGNIPHDSQSSLPCQGQETLVQSSQQPCEFMSEEEFMHLMNSPPPSTLSGNSQVPQNVFSCPSTFRSPLPGFTQSLLTPISRGTTFSEPGVQVRAGEKSSRVEKEKEKRALKRAVGRKTKKAKIVVELSNEEGDGDEGGAGTRWSDPEVLQLISFRLEMDEEFIRNAKKQGVNSWDKLQNQMIAACENFSKTSEACRNKWKTVYRQYCTDKRLLQISGEGRKVTCKFFDEIDQGFNNAANVKKLVHNDGRGTSNPCPLEINNGGEGQGSGESNDVSPSDATTPLIEISSHSSKVTKKTSAEVSTGLLSDIVQHTKSIATDIHESNALIKDIKNQLERLIDKL